MLAAEYQGAVMGIRNMQYTEYSEAPHERNSSTTKERPVSVSDIPTRTSCGPFVARCRPNE